MTNHEPNDSFPSEFNFDDFDISEFSEPTVETLTDLYEVFDLLKSKARKHTKHETDDYGNDLTFTDYSFAQDNENGRMVFIANEAPASWLAEMQQEFAESDASFPLYSISYSGPAGSGHYMSFDQYYGAEPNLFISDKTAPRVEQDMKPNASSPMGGYALSSFEASNPEYARMYYDGLAERSEAENNGATKLTDSGVRRFTSTISEFLAES